MLKKLFISLLIFIFLIFSVFFIYLNIGHYKSLENMDNYSNYIDHEEYLEFNNNSNIGFIFYPGAKVESESYSYLSNLNANVYIARFPFEMAMFDYKIADKIILDNPDIDSWYIGGHSLGGVFAAEEVKLDSSKFEGIVYLASYPAKENDLLINELAIFGEDDLVVGDYNKHIEALGNNAQIEVLENSNHSGFGNYGQQKGDSELNNSYLTNQRNLVIELINNFISNN